MHYDGNTWNRMDIPLNVYLNKMWGNSSSNIYAACMTTASDAGYGEIIDYDGENWTQVDIGEVCNLGADDYLTKPFGASGLISRVRAVLRRNKASATIPTQPSFASGDLEINFAQRRVAVAGIELKLTPTEYALLQELVLNAGKVLTHTHLLDKVWGLEYREDTQYLHVFVRRLRAKLEPDPTDPRYIVTTPGVGYQFTPTA